MKVKLIVSAPMTYKGVKFNKDDEFEVTEDFYNLHPTRLEKVETKKKAPAKKAAK